MTEKQNDRLVLAAERFVEMYEKDVELKLKLDRQKEEANQAEHGREFKLLAVAYSVIGEILEAQENARSDKKVGVECPDCGQTFISAEAAEGHACTDDVIDAGEN